MHEWKVFYDDHEFVAQTSSPTLAEFVMGAMTDGSCVKWKHRKVVFKNGPGFDEDIAANSADEAAILMEKRRDQYLADREARRILGNQGS